jgi:uncharacterized protein (TIGR02679 family)
MVFRRDNRLIEKCGLCGGRCLDAELNRLLDSRLLWLWDQLARAADRRGDATLAEGILQVRIPDSAEERAATGGLLGPRRLSKGQNRRIDLAELTAKLRLSGKHLTPGAVAAHALGRPLATGARARVERARQEEILKALLCDCLGALSAKGRFCLIAENVWPTLKRMGWVSRILSNGDGQRLVQAAMATLAQLAAIDDRIDRRRLATNVTGNPHALDEGTRLAGLVLAILSANGDVSQQQRPRLSWAQIGVDCDDVTGGLICLGIFPVGWQLPISTPITIPPRVLKTCQWTKAEANSRWVFVTENPSVLSAAADLTPEDPNVRLICTSGTPSAVEISALARLAGAGWQLAVRADFDKAGLAHVASLLKGIANALPWRMGCEDYLQSLVTDYDDPLSLGGMVDVPWDPGLAAAMNERGLAAFEETLLPLLMYDLQHGKQRPTDEMQA